MKKGNVSKPSRIVEMTLIHPNAAGIDIGDTLHSVAVPLGRDTECVKNFGAFTCDLVAIVEWLKKCGVDTVAIESTGGYTGKIYTVCSSKTILRYIYAMRGKPIISQAKKLMKVTHNVYSAYIVAAC
jgi:transposase